MSMTNSLPENIEIILNWGNTNCTHSMVKKSMLVFIAPLPSSPYLSYEYVDSSIAKH